MRATPALSWAHVTHTTVKCSAGTLGQSHLSHNSLHRFNINPLYCLHSFSTFTTTIVVQFLNSVGTNGLRLDPCMFLTLLYAWNWPNNELVAGQAIDDNNNFRCFISHVFGRLRDVYCIMHVILYCVQQRHHDTHNQNLNVDASSMRWKI